MTLCVCVHTARRVAAFSRGRQTKGASSTIHGSTGQTPVTRYEPARVKVLFPEFSRRNRNLQQTAASLLTCCTAVQYHLSLSAVPQG